MMQKSPHKGKEHKPPRKLTMKEFEHSKADKEADKKGLAAHNAKAKKAVSKDQPKGGKGEGPLGPAAMSALAIQPAQQATPIDFPAKLQGLFRPHRYKVLYGGRGSAKSWSAARALLIIAAKSKVRILCARELQNSISESVHKLLCDQIDALGLSHVYQIQQASIVCTATGSEFFFEGIRNNINKIKSYEGVDYCWVEEAHAVSSNSWGVLIPTIRKELKDPATGAVTFKSEIWITFNPELETDATYKEFVLNPKPDSFVVKMNWRDNEWFPQVLFDEMLDLKSKDVDSYLHIWEGNCKANLEGAVYAKELRAALEEDRICKLPYDPVTGVSTFWDLGISDYTSIWFAQRVGFNYHIIDYYENTGYGLDHYLSTLQAKKYIYDTLWLPHDAKAREKGTGKSIEELAKSKGNRVRIVPKLKLFDGINAARTVFPKLLFDADKCDIGIQHLRRYRYDVQKEHGQPTGTFSNSPKHDEHSHAADALRYLAVGLREPKRNVTSKVREALGFVPRSPLAQDGWLR